MMPAIHAKYVQHAFQNIISVSALTIVKKASKYSDVVHNHYIKGQHGGPETSDCIQFISKINKYIVKKLENVSKNIETKGSKEKIDKTLTEAFYAEGIKDHAIQDFFSHTNWLHLDPTPTSKDFQAILLGEKPVPEKLFNCKFMFKEDIPETLGWGILKLIPKKLMKKLFEAIEPVYKAQQKDMPVSHCLMNFDKPGTIEDEFFKTIKGFSGFERASEEAIKATQSIFERGVKAPLTSSLGDDKAKKLFTYLQNWQPADPEFINNSNRIGEEAFQPLLEGFIINKKKYQTAQNIQWQFGELIPQLRTQV